MKQQDSMEMFSALMDNLHEDLNRVRKKPVTEPVEDKSRPDDVVAKEAWEVYVVFERGVRARSARIPIISHFHVSIT